MSYITQEELDGTIRKARVLGDIKDLKHLRFDLHQDVKILREEIAKSKVELRKVREAISVTVRTKESEEIVKNLTYSRLDRICIELASRVVGVSIEDMKSTQRARKIIVARRLVYVYLRELDSRAYSFSTLGKIFKQDHATVMNAMKKHYFEYGVEKWHNKDYTEMYDAFRTSMDNLAKENQDGQ